MTRADHDLHNGGWAMPPAPALVLRMAPSFTVATLRASIRIAARCIEVAVYAVTGIYAASLWVVP